MLYRSIILTISLIIIVLNPVTVMGENTVEVEIFHIKHESIVKKQVDSFAIHKEVENCLQSISNLSNKFNPIPDDGIMMKIPITPPIQVNNRWLRHYVEEIIIIHHSTDQQLLLVFDDENKAYFFEFSYSLTDLLALLE